jgi:molecular chaperone DnaK
MKTTPDPIVGIDLGTTNSAIAAVTEKGIEIIPVHGRRTMPSAVGISPSGEVIVGQAAKNQAISAPESTLLSVKRLMGTSQTVVLGDRTYRPEEISAVILRELKQAAEKHLGCEVKKAVITVPAFFNERERQATQDAGRLAGLDVLRIINEPTAAALAYGAGDPDRASETLLVYDLGGGTFDVSLVTVENGVVEVRASHGDTHLGGDDFDEALANLAAKRFQEKSGTAPGDLSDSARRRLKAVMEEAKITLSDQPFASVNEEFLTATEHLVTEFSRADYEDLIEPFVAKTFECLQRALADGGITASDVNKVMLVGGATRTPFIQEVIAARMGLRPRHEIDPDLIVAMGAALQGAALAGLPSPAILVDISAHTYSAEVLKDGLHSSNLFCVPIIPRGTPIPVKKADVFTTITDSQPHVAIRIFRGEGQRPFENTLIGEVAVEGLAPVPRGNQILVEFRIDLNGLLNITAKEKKTGLAKTVTINTGAHHRINLDAAHDNLALLFGEEPEDAQAEMLVHGNALASAKSLRQRAEAILRSGVSASDAEAIRQLLEESSIAVVAGDTQALGRIDDKLSDILFYLED